MHHLQRKKVFFCPKTHLCPRGKVDGHKCKPDDARGVHSESNIFGLIEGFRDLARQHGIDSAHGNDEKRVPEGHRV